MNYFQRLGSAILGKTPEAEMPPKKDERPGMRHFDYDQAPRTQKLAHLERIGYQTIEDMEEETLYNTSTVEALQGIAIFAMKRLRTKVFHQGAEKDDLTKLDKAIYKVSTALMA